MTVKIATTDDYVTVRQKAYFEEPTNLRPDEARDLAENLQTLADKVEE